MDVSEEIFKYELLCFYGILNIYDLDENMILFGINDKNL